MSLIADTAVKFLDAFLMYETVKIYQSSTIDTVNPPGSDIGTFFFNYFSFVCTYILQAAREQV